MTTEHESTRTLVKSPPELWAECSDAASLARHLDGFGEIRIMRLEPETAVAWEGERASGTVRLEPSGWGTKVTLTAVAPAGAAPPAAPAGPTPEAPPVRAPASTAEEPPAPAAQPQAPEPAVKRGLARWLGIFRRSPAPAAVASPVPGRSQPPATAPPAPTAPPAGVAPAEILAAALESLGQAHRRPFVHGSSGGPA